MTMRIPYSLPDIGDREHAAVHKALKSGWVTTGPESAAFEQEFAEFLNGGVTALAVNSATSGLHLAIEALGIGPGDEVIVPTMTFTATAEIVRYVGADPIFVDCDRRTMNICPSAIRSAITAKTKAIIIVHFAGLACDMHAIMAISNAANIPVIEDAAHAFPATFGGRLIGTFETAATVFSFYANKTMTTGEGGMVVSRNTELLSRMRLMRLHGIDRDAFDRFRSEKPAWEYAVVAPGFKYNMTDVAAAMGRVQLTRIESFQARRNELAERYHSAFADLPLTLPATASQGDRHAWHIYAIRLHGVAGNSAARGRFIEQLAKQGIGTSVHYIPLHRHPYWQQRYSLSISDFPEAENIYEATISLPLYTRMSNDDQIRVIESVRDLVLNDGAWR